MSQPRYAFASLALFVFGPGAFGCTVAPYDGSPVPGATGGTPSTTGGTPGTTGGEGGGGAGGGGGGVVGGGGGNAPATGGAPPLPEGEWVNTTGNLAGLESECGNMSLVAAKPDEDLLIAGIALRGLWTSRDGGETWEQRGQGEGSDEILNRPSRIIFDPEDTKAYWESGIYTGRGVFRTQDEGETFKSLGEVGHTDLAAVDMTDPERKHLLAGGHETAHALWRTTNGGESWTNIGDGLPDGQTCTLPMFVDGTTFLVGCQAPKPFIYRTTDAGKTWNQAADVGGGNAPIRAQDGSIWWVSPQALGMARSTDDGESWEQVTGGGILSSLAPVELPDGRIVMVGFNRLLITSDLGKNWVPLSPILPFNDSFGVTYSVHRKAFYLWHFTCINGPIPVPDDAIMRYDFDYETQ